MKTSIAAVFLAVLLCFQNASAKPVKEYEAKQFARKLVLEKVGEKVDIVSTKEKTAGGKVRYIKFSSRGNK